MCIFTGQHAKLVEGLLPTAASFPLPIQDEFPGDVMIGWRTWDVSLRTLISPVYATQWPSDRALVSRPPRLNSFGHPQGQGIYAYGSEEAVRSRLLRHIPPYRRRTQCWGSVAMWGTVLDFRRGLPMGCMAEFAYPLEVNFGAGAPIEHAENVAKKYGPYGVHVFHGDEQLA
jgi:hypothetical protein